MENRPSLAQGVINRTIIDQPAYMTPEAHFTQLLGDNADIFENPNVDPQLKWQAQIKLMLDADTASALQEAVVMDSIPSGVMFSISQN